MTEDHERIEELLAGYALESLTGPDAEEAELLLAEHVPTCPTCRGLLREFHEAVGDLALAADPEPAPEILLASLRRDIGETNGLARRRSALPAWVGTAAAVAAVALVAMGGLSAFLFQRMNTVQGEAEAVQNAAVLFADPASRIVPMDEERDTEGTATIAWKPGEPACALVVDRIKEPRRRHEYQVWLAKDGTPRMQVASFLHKRRTTTLWMVVDLAGYDQIWIVEGREDDDAVPTAPVLTADLER